MPKKIKPVANAVRLVLRTCNAHLISYNGFRWPESGYVAAIDWQDTDVCGNGLHGLLDGSGEGRYLNWADDAKWLVVEVAESDLRYGSGDLTNKCKFHSGYVVYCGNRSGALNYLKAAGVDMTKCVGAQIAVEGDRSQASSSGDLSQASSSGDQSQASSSGYQSQASSSGGRSQASSSGDLSQASSSGDLSQASSSGDLSQASSSGDQSQASSSGYQSQASSSGDLSQASSSGYQSQALSSGYRSQASSSGDQSLSLGWGSVTKARSARYGILALRYWDGARYRLIVGYVGEDNIQPNTWYQLDCAGKFVECTESELNNYDI
jgi:hypothetical protein